MSKHGIPESLVRETRAHLPKAHARAITKCRTDLAERSLRGDNIPQRTAPWYERRGHTVGGSGASELVSASDHGKPIACTPRTVNSIRKVADKLHETRQTEAARTEAKKTGDPEPLRWWTVPTAWGTVLEPLTEEMIFSFSS